VPAWDAGWKKAITTSYLLTFITIKDCSVLIVSTRWLLHIINISSRRNAVIVFVGEDHFVRVEVTQKTVSVMLEVPSARRMGWIWAEV
jgi:hypothetical protein